MPAPKIFTSDQQDQEAEQGCKTAEIFDGVDELVVEITPGCENRHDKRRSCKDLKQN